MATLLTSRGIKIKWLRVKLHLCRRSCGSLCSDRRTEYLPTDREKLWSLRDKRLVSPCVCAPALWAWQQAGANQITDGQQVNFLQLANTLINEPEILRCPHCQRKETAATTRSSKETRRDVKESDSGSDALPKGTSGARVQLRLCCRFEATEYLSLLANF